MVEILIPLALTDGYRFRFKEKQCIEIKRVTKKYTHQLISFYIYVKRDHGKQIFVHWEKSTRVENKQWTGAHTFTMDYRSLLSQKFKVLSMSWCDQILFTYCRALHKVIINLQRERENNIYAFRLDNRVDGQVTCLFYQERKRNRERERKRFSFLSLVSPFSL